MKSSLAKVTIQNLPKTTERLMPIDSYNSQSERQRRQSQPANPFSPALMARPTAAPRQTASVVQSPPPGPSLMDQFREGFRGFGSEVASIPQAARNALIPLTNPDQGPSFQDRMPVSNSFPQPVSLPPQPADALADRIGRTMPGIFEAKNARGVAGARQQGIENFRNSDVGQASLQARLAVNRNRNMGQMAGGDYGDMDREQAIRSSRNFYRGGGQGLSGSLAAREDALEQAGGMTRAERDQATRERFSATRDAQRNMLAQALADQGEEFDPALSEARNARNLERGTTLRGTAPDGTPMMVSRGHASMNRPDRRNADGLTQDEVNRNIRQQRISRLNQAGQMRLASNQAQQQAAQQSMLMQRLMAVDPRSAVAMQLGQGELGLRGMEAAQQAMQDQQQGQRDDRRLGMDEELNRARVQQTMAETGMTEAQARTLVENATPEAMDNTAIRGIAGDMVANGIVPPAQIGQVVQSLRQALSPGEAPSPEQAGTQAGIRNQLAQTGAAVDAAFGEGTSAMSGPELLDMVRKRQGTSAALGDADLQMLQDYYRMRSRVDPDFSPGSYLGSLATSPFTPTPLTVYRQRQRNTLAERLLGDAPVTAAGL